MYAQKATQYRPENDLFTNQKIGILLKPLVHGFGRKFKRFSLLLNLEIGILLTRLVTGFGRKFEVFSFFYFRSKQKQNQFGNALDRKQLYIDQKNKLFSGSKNWHSSKAVSRLVHGFNRKLEIFPIFFLSKQKQLQKVLDRKQSYIDQKNDLFTKSKNWHSSKGVSPWIWSETQKVFFFFFA